MPANRLIKEITGRLFPFLAFHLPRGKFLFIGEGDFLKKDFPDSGFDFFSAKEPQDYFNTFAVIFWLFPPQLRPFLPKIKDSLQPQGSFIAVVPENSLFPLELRSILTREFLPSNILTLSFHYRDSDYLLAQAKKP